MLKPLNIKIYLNLKSTFRPKKEEKVRAGLYDTRLWGFKKAFSHLTKCTLENILILMRKRLIKESESKIKNLTITTLHSVWHSLLWTHFCWYSEHIELG